MKHLRVQGALIAGVAILASCELLLEKDQEIEELSPEGFRFRSLCPDSLAGRIVVKVPLYQQFPGS